MTLRRAGMTCALALVMGTGANACETAGFKGLDGLRLHRPTPSAVVSGFGMRTHPLLQISRFHPGLDFAVSHGEPVQAAAKGRVAHAGPAGESGITIRIDHGDGLLTAYDHLSRIGAQVGDCVAEGAVIGFAGATGLSAGPQLHFEVRVEGKPVDPAPPLSK
jgi:murein DD-endopeptidase MepM/ murein hydrolase activator NlpD